MSLIYLVSMPLLPVFLLTMIVGDAYENWPALFCGFFLLLVSSMVLVLSYTNAQRFSISNRPFNRVQVILDNKYLLLIYSSAALYYIYFYTGQNFSSIFINMYLGTSNYASYQTYFADHVGNLPITAKILPISCGIFVKFYLIYTVLRYLRKYFSDETRPKLKELTKVVLVILCYITTALARGTFFEVLELVLLFIFGLLNFWTVRLTKSQLVSYVFLGLLACLLIYLFYLNIELRGSQKFCVTETICLNSNSSLVYKISFILSGYFVFGLYFTGVTFLFAVDKFGVSALLFGLQETDKSELREMICERVIDCGVTWHPEYSVLFGSYGFFTSLLIIYFVGFVFGVIQKSWLRSQSLFYLVLGYFSVLRIFSFFIGDFVFVSSSNTVLYTLSIIIVVTALRFSSTRGLRN